MNLRIMISIPLILHIDVTIDKVYIYIDGPCGSKNQSPIVLHTIYPGNSRAQFRIYFQRSD